MGGILTFVTLTNNPKDFVKKVLFFFATGNFITNTTNKEMVTAQLNLSYTKAVSYSEMLNTGSGKTWQGFDSFSYSRF